MGIKLINRHGHSIKWTKAIVIAIDRIVYLLGWVAIGIWLFGGDFIGLITFYSQPDIEIAVSGIILTMLGTKPGTKN